ncbi:MAG: aromatic ring-hydroxylating dioxygenase subunit alpha [Pirellulales bacterium]|nr:aromatic ring-hydroxylating dioxygenase subunit alpha [Pirellulales bacterium]
MVELPAKLRDTRLEVLADLIARRKANQTLERDFFVCEDIYQADVEQIWRRGWLVAGYTCQIPQPGDYFTFEVDTDSILVIRGDDGKIRALHNICRHRGTILCDAPLGHAGRIICPYHQWVYARDGALVSCRGMHDVDKASLGLLPLHVEVLAGLVFVSLAERAPDFAAVRELLEPLLRPQGLDRAKIAALIEYDIDANWKLVWENNRECYHCNVNHPQYIKANFDHYNADDTSPRIRGEIDAAVSRSETKWAADGLAVTHRQTGMTTFPDPERGIWYSANRTPLVEGFVSESLDGRQVAPLMGDYRDPDVGTLRVRTLPNFWCHASCDHAVATRLLPAGRAKTRAQVAWLIAADAVEGRDYELERLLPFWQLTSEQDWQLCDRAQRGICSQAYKPGPYSTYKEYNVDAFVRWYLQQLTQG